MSRKPSARNGAESGHITHKERLTSLFDLPISLGTFRLQNSTSDEDPALIFLCVEYPVVTMDTPPDLVSCLALQILYVLFGHNSPLHKLR